MTGPELTEFFHRHRTLLIIGVLFFHFVGLAVLGYNKYQQHQMQQAALLYSELVNATVHKNNSVARASAESIINTYNHTPYGTLAHFFLARLDMEDKQVAVAEKAFKAIIDHHEVPLGMHSLARLSLARLYVDHHHPHKALILLTKVSKAFAAITDEIQGDAYTALDQPEKAEQAYKSAITALPVTSPYRRYLQLKEANIGVVP